MPSSDRTGPLGSGLSLRPIRPRDRAFLYKIYAGTRAEEFAVVPWDEAEKERFLQWQFDAQHKFYMEQFPAARFDIVLQRRRRIGRLYVDRRAEEIRIIDIALLPERRGNGIGGMLMRELLDEAAAAGKPVRIHVEKFNRALGLYRRLGFSQIEDQGVYLLMQWLPPAGKQ
jgi:ribosomal protein S18 acetylase RimI-like enzyme